MDSIVKSIIRENGINTEGYIIEKLSKLQVEVMKVLRGNGNKTSLIDACVDVSIVIDVIQELYNIKDEEFYNRLDVLLTLYSDGEEV